MAASSFGSLFCALHGEFRIVFALRYPLVFLFCHYFLKLQPAFSGPQPEVFVHLGGDQGRFAFRGAGVMAQEFGIPKPQTSQSNRSNLTLESNVFHFCGFFHYSWVVTDKGLMFLPLEWVDNSRQISGGKLWCEASSLKKGWVFQVCENRLIIWNGCRDLFFQDLSSKVGVLINRPSGNP